MTASPDKGTSNFANKPTCIVVLGMAGSGKTTFVKKLIEHLNSIDSSFYSINLDPAVQYIPYSPNIDIRDTISFKDVMKQYGFGPNGAIMTSLNMFTSRFHSVLDLIKKQEDNVKYVVIDTPGQIEVFTWSASGVIITEALSSSYPTVVLYLLDTPRSHNAITFMSNMLYSCSIMYRMKLPLVVVMNKTDVIDCQFAVEWMQDFEKFQEALNEQRGDLSVPNVGANATPYMTSLTNSMSLVLDEFYSELKNCGVSSLTGEGFDSLMESLTEARTEFITDYWPAIQKSREQPKAAPSTLLDATDDEVGICRPKMLVDMVSRADNASSDVMVDVDGQEEPPYTLYDEDDVRPNITRPLNTISELSSDVNEKCSISSKK